jgi:phosphate transport system permease protein
LEAIGMKKNSTRSDFLITLVIKVSGYSAIFFVLIIFYFLLSQGLPALKNVPLSSLFSARWYPIEEYFGILPLISGSLVVTITATLIALPMGVGTAIFIAEVVPRWVRELLKPLIEILAGLPSVVLGFLGIVALSPLFRNLFNLPTGLSAFTGAVLLAAISLPTIVSVAEDTLDAVPKAYRDAAQALGATRWETIWTVTLPAAQSGVLTAVMLGIARSIGETMTVMMVTGNAPVLLDSLKVFLSPVRTMTATIAAEMGEVATGSDHYHVLFFIGIVLFLITLIVNVTASSVVYRRSQKRSEKLLS